MRVISWMGLTILAGVLTASVAQAQPRGAVSLPTEQMLNSVGLTRAWWGHAVTNSARDKLVHLTLDGSGRLFTQSSNSVLTCFDAESGRRLWATRLGAADDIILPCSFSEDLVFCIHGNTCFGVRKTLGDVVWELDLPSTPSVSPSTDGKHLYVGMVDGSMYAFDYKKVSDLSQKGLMPRWSYTTTVWRYKTSESIISQAVPSGRLVAFASANGSLYSVTADDRRLVYQFETDAQLSAPVVRYRDWLILSGQDFNVYALHVDNGKIGWQFPAGSDIRKAPVVIRDDLYVMPERRGLYKLTAETGVAQWWNPRARDLVSASPDKAYVRGPSNNLMVLSGNDGAELGILPLEAFGRHVRNDVNDRIYLASTTGLIVCLREIDLDFPASHYDLDNKPIVPLIGPDNVEVPPTAPAEPATEAAPSAEPAAAEPANPDQ